MGFQSVVDLLFSPVDVEPALDDGRLYLNKRNTGVGRTTRLPKDGQVVPFSGVMKHVTDEDDRRRPMGPGVGCFGIGRLEIVLLLTRLMPKDEDDPAVNVDTGVIVIARLGQTITGE